MRTIRIWLKLDLFVDDELTHEILIGSDRIVLDRIGSYRFGSQSISCYTFNHTRNHRIQPMKSKHSNQMFSFPVFPILELFEEVFFQCFLRTRSGRILLMFFSPTINRNLMWNENAIIELNERREKLNVRIEKLTKNWVFSHIFQNCSESKGSISSLKNGCLVHWINAGSQRIN